MPLKIPYRMTLEEILERVKRIDYQIEALTEVREIIVRQDAEYSAYLDEFMVRGEGVPLDIRRFHRAACELEQINLMFNSVSPMTSEFNEMWIKHHWRLVELVDLLLA